MGDIADMMLAMYDGDDGWQTEWENRPPKQVTCNRCGAKHLEWGYIAKGKNGFGSWRLFNPGGGLHVCHPPDKAPRDRTVAPCQYCGHMPKMVTGAEVYPHRPDLSDLPFWACWTCQAWVGCHPGTLHPLGTVANKELRKLRSKVHEKFDPLWKSKLMKRADAYRLLRTALKLSKNDCHISKFDEAQCTAALEAIAKLSVN